MEQKNKKRYLFISDTDFGSNKLTGAHKRFLELVRSVAKTEEVLMVTNKIPQLSDCQNLSFFYLESCELPLPKHIEGMLRICKTLIKEKKKLVCDYAISFGLIGSVCYRICGIKNIISLLREDSIGYLNATGASRYKIGYFKYLERVAIRASEKIIVQCNADRLSIINRNKKYCKNIEDKIYVQINNANASWMNIEGTEKEIKNSYDRILFIGDFSNSRKGHGILLPAIARLIDEGYYLELLVAGCGKELEEYKQQYINYPTINFLGRVNINHYIKTVDFLIVPSIIDSCPNTVLEALNAGVAVYGTNAGGIPDLLVESQYLFKASEESIYFFVKKVIDEKAYVRDAEQQRKRKEALTFDWGLNIKSIIEM